MISYSIEHRCEICGKKFNSKQSLTHHNRLHTGVKPFRCKICDATFHTKSHLKYHVKSHAEQAHKCEICDKNFCNKQSLTNHKRLHTGEKPFQCELCGETFRTKPHLIYHMKSHAEKVGKTYRCELCDETFNTKSDFKYHIKSHAEEPVQKCDICDKNFCNKQSLTNHKRLHTGEKPFQCELCDAVFRTKSHLQYHMKKHLVKNVASDVVSVVTKDNSDHQLGLRENNSNEYVLLTKGNTEMIFNNTTRKHQCTDCGKAFRNAGRLKVHKRKHTGEMPHVCPVCDRRFRRMRRWKNHVLIDCNYIRAQVKEDELKKKTKLSNTLAIFHKSFPGYCTKMNKRHDMMKSNLKPNTVRADVSANQCEVCHKEFARKWTLLHHLNKHFAAKPYSCTVCEKSYGWKNSLDRHMKCHSNLIT